jgi:hypothetical protein
MLPQIASNLFFAETSDGSLRSVLNPIQARSRSYQTYKQKSREKRNHSERQQAEHYCP